MAYQLTKIPLSRVFLDNINPRHDPIDNEREIIAHLVAEEDVKPLAKDIALAGLNPMDRIAVVSHPTAKNAYVVLEGNRRQCAIKLLNDPEKAVNEADRKYFRSLVKTMTKLPIKIEVVLFDTRDSARRWLSIRHEGPLGGRGTKQWSAGGKTRFNLQGEAKNSPNIQAAMLLAYARTRGLLSDSQMDQVKLTTITRYLSTPAFRATLGLFDHKTLTLLVPQEEFDIAVTRFLTDSLDGDTTGVNSRTQSLERAAYGQKLKAEGVAPSTKLDELVVLDPLRAAPPPEQAQWETKPKRGRDNKSPDDRRNVIPPTFTAIIEDRVMKRLYDELKTVNADTYAFAATYLLRAVIEQAVNVYGKKKGMGFNDDMALHLRMQRAGERLVEDGAEATLLKNWRVMANVKDSRYSPDTLGNTIHGNKIPSKAEINRHWENVEPVMRLLLDAVR